ncbi:BON domain-containing protein [Stappia indica]|uniref:BON domain-containing protein n=1 Tax=Stappia indica TaxID=538381 RepID=A0A857C6G5_9HYPH|nr:BON domain-containing protein [Stappia indica]QGZ34626.1 BON domain-containing protein [Stappia indica]
MVQKDRRFFGEAPEFLSERAAAAEMEHQVASALANDGTVDASDVTVTADHGGITLAGTVASTQEIARCSQIALEIGGVRHVRNIIGIWGSKM